MEMMVRGCAGLEVHKDSGEGCVRKLEPDGKLSQPTGHWGTTTGDFIALAEWMKVEGVTQVAMESTGVYRKPICNIREGNFEVLLGNGQKLKHVPGHKTDIQDGQWIAPRLQPGRFQGRLIPPRWQRELRDLTRQRVQGIGEPSRTVHRMQKVMEDAKLKLGGVASEVVGVSGRRRLRAIIAGESNPEQLADLAQRQLRGKIPQVPEARFGNITEQPRWRLSLLWDQLSARLDERIAQLPRPQQPALEKVDPDCRD
jgi:transposase